MKRLYVLRHAKSDWSDPALDDHDRPLNARGERAAALMAIYLVQRDANPGLVLCSTARRAQQTLGFVRERLDGEPRVLIERGLYLAGRTALAERIAQVEETESSVLLIGHNPGLTELVAWLDADAHADMPTAALASLALRVDRWSDLTRGAAELEDYALPKRLV